MEIQDIIKMVDEDLVQAISQNEQESVDSLVCDFMAARQRGEEGQVELFITVHSLCNYLKQPGNFAHIFASEDLLSLAECLQIIVKLPWAKGNFGNLCIEGAYWALFRHFEYGNELEKGFAAVDIQHLFKYHHERMNGVLVDLIKMAYADPNLQPWMTEVNQVEDEAWFLNIQIPYAMVPFIHHLYELFPHMEDTKVISDCEELEKNMDDFGISPQKILRKAHLLSVFIEERIKKYEGEEEID